MQKRLTAPAAEFKQKVESLDLSQIQHEISQNNEKVMSS